MNALIGIDIGTSGAKTSLFTEGGEVIASYTGEYPMHQPYNGWAEQDPKDWWDASVKGLNAVIYEARKKDSSIAISGVGLSGQMHGLVMLDKDGEVLRPSIIWCDQRTEREVELMNEVVGRERLIRITANPAMTGFTAAKILWVQNNEPDIYERCAHILLPKDYIRYMLTGEFATEVSDAAGMQLMDIPNRDWSDEILRLLHIDRGLLAKMHESPDVTGRVHSRAAAGTGLPQGTIVVGGAGDNPAAAVGTGVVSEGVAFTTIGSSAVVYAVSDTVKIDMEGRVHALCASAPGKWTVMSCTQGAGISLKWLRDTCCLPEVLESERLDVDPYVVMDKLASEVAPGADRLIFLPYMMGERSPHPDPDCRGVFFGLSAMHGRQHLIRSVLEGVAFSQLECVEVFREMGVPVGDMVITGGGSNSRLWSQMLADLYGCPVSGMRSNEGAALGAALLAAVGAGVYGTVQEACSVVVRRGHTLTPDQASKDAYEPYFELYKKLYKTMKDDFKALSRL
ncbi:MAG: xylulokinase [Clostridiales Family XIII bacterium]|jgi:xylulokinase|nr:xylulokinase [Clostridiales Family XIII bacterium]